MTAIGWVLLLLLLSVGDMYVCWSPSVNGFIIFYFYRDYFGAFRLQFNFEKFPEPRYYLRLIHVTPLLSCERKKTRNATENKWIYYESPKQ